MSAASQNTRPGITVGATYGNWRVLAKGRMQKRERYMHCRCACGTEKEVNSRALRTGASTSCGCRRKEFGKMRRGRPCPRRENGAGLVYQLFYKYKKQAEGRDYTFNLTEDFFSFIVRNPCWYCGHPPSIRVRYTRGVTSLYLSGVDRVDNAHGYEVDNVVPCCGVCNRAKSDMSADDFLSWARRIREKSA